MSEVASHADLWYNKHMKLFVAAMLEAPRDVSRYWIGVPTMDTLPPHAQDGNIPNASGIYRITCTVTKRIYLGSTNNLRKRQWTHFYELRQNRHGNVILQRAWNKYGSDTFTFEVLELVLPMSLTTREQYWFKKLKPFGKRGFNIARDAKGPPSAYGRKHTPETRKRIGQAHYGKKVSADTCGKMKQSHLGHSVSPETREKMSLAHIGNKHSPEAREKMRLAKLGKKRSPEILKQGWVTRRRNVK